MKAATANPDAPAAGQDSLAAALDRRTVPGQLWRAEGEFIRCLACGHRCRLAEGRRGICKVRFNAAGVLRVPFGYAAGVACDPIEKKPFFHVLPGGAALTFGTLGCDFHCAYCQNWLTSQVLRDRAAVARFHSATPEQLVAAAQRHGARMLVSSYNEPLITAEWAAAVFARAKPAGLRCGFVSNGNGTPEALDFLAPWLDACKVDLKCFSEAGYRALGGRLEPVKETIRALHQRGIWVEVVTLLVPGFNDDDQELTALTEFIASVSPDLPWHVTAFHPDYQMTGPRPTQASDLLRAVEFGVEAGLRFVYAGNLPGRVVPWEDTRCPQCGETLIARRGFQVDADHLSDSGACFRCGCVIPGIWKPWAPAGILAAEPSTPAAQAAPEDRA
jgi:pyruvate formate lyase activating enzyme